MIKDERTHLNWLENGRLLALIMILSFHWWGSAINKTTSLPVGLNLYQYISLAPKILIESGYTAVTIFFFISAVGLTLSKKKPFSLINFYIKRAKRIYPSYWLTIISALMIIMISGIPVILMKNNLFFWIKNIFLIFPNSNLIPSSTGYINVFWWFLFTLVQFYLVFPAFYNIVRKLRYAGLIFAILINLLLPTIQALIGIPVPALLYQITVFYTGILVGLIVNERKIVFKNNNFIGLGGIVIWCLGIFLSYSKQFSAYYGLIIFAGIVLTLIFLLNFRLPSKFYYVNKISYQIYLVHNMTIPIIGYIFARMFPNHAVLTWGIVLYVPLTVIWALLIYRTDNVAQSLFGRISLKSPRLTKMQKGTKIY